MSKTSVISYLAAKPSRDLIRVAHQEVTRKWWQNQRHVFALFYNEAELALGIIGGNLTCTATPLSTKSIRLGRNRILRQKLLNS